ncbi:MAG TPA: hypothetical protein VGC95_00370, partial [Chitinophagaceae bacterium]
MDDPNFPGRTLSDYYVGDPQWIGILQFPNQPHSRNNKFIARYAYMIVPAGKTLDINYIANQARSYDMVPTSSGYLRSQGFGSWEVNLPALLADLNTNYWGYNLYDPTVNAKNQGTAFDDTIDLLRHRYIPSYIQAANRGYGSLPRPHQNLPTAAMMFAYVPNLVSIFTNDLVDAYANTGPGTFGLPLSSPADADDDVTQPWSAGESKQHFFTVEDFYNRNSVDYPTFRDRLLNAAKQNSFYNRYTLTRLLTQVGTDSVPEPDGISTFDTNVVKVNINYSNIGFDTNGNPAHSTNLVSWRPVDLFSNIAEVLIRQEFTNFGAGGIPVVTNNVHAYVRNGVTNRLFSPRVRQLLQIAANIQDATTDTPYPSVFRPLFGLTNNNIYITGFAEETNTAMLTMPWVDVQDANGRTQLASNLNAMVYNIGAIVGAKKNLPNFSEFKFATALLVSRKLNFPKRQPSDQHPYATNQLFSIGISNAYGLKAWNSYSNDFKRPFIIRADYDVKGLLTNTAGKPWSLPAPTNTGPIFFPTNGVSANTWIGTSNIILPIMSETFL